MDECQFFDVEILDGYFSGVIHIMTENRRFILSFGYDIEFKKLTLFNCNNPMYDSEFIKYTPEEIEEIKEKYAYFIYPEIDSYLLLNEK